MRWGCQRNNQRSPKTLLFVFKINVQNPLRSELRAYNSTQAAYRRWREQTLAYYSANAVKCTEPEELDRDELIARRTELLGKEYCKNESNK